MDLIEKVENYRRTKGCSKADMARLFGVPLQNYNNWVYRGSLPKGHIGRAQELLADQKDAALLLLEKEIADFSQAELAELAAYIELVKRRKDGGF